MVRAAECAAVLRGQRFLRDQKVVWLENTSRRVCAWPRVAHLFFILSCFLSFLRPFAMLRIIAFLLTNVVSNEDVSKDRQFPTPLPVGAAPDGFGSPCCFNFRKEKMRRVFDSIATAACVAASPFAIEQPSALNFIPMLGVAASLNKHLFRSHHLHL